MRKALYILFASLAMTWVSTSPMHANEQYIDPVFGDTIDRTAEDFVTVSLLVADPGAATYSVFGHACLRMQCPVFGLDYCYTYESEEVKNRIGDFLAGNLMMGLFAIPVNVYCDGYREEGRGVYEYKLNLPPSVEQNLWRILDQHVAEGSYMPYDYFKRGCTITCVRFIEEALHDANRRIQYDSILLNRKATSKDIVLSHCEKFKWARFIFCFLAAGEADKYVIGSDQLCVPAELVKAWQNATIDGEPLLAQEPVVLLEGEPQWPDDWFTPIMLSVLLLVLAIANLFWSRPYGDWIFLCAQSVVGVFMIYLICFSDLCCTSWNWLIVPFNILPAIAWHWRRYWALPYACALIIWCGVMAGNMLWGHVLVDWSHIILVLAWIVVLLKQSHLFKRITKIAI